MWRLTLIACLLPAVIHAREIIVKPGDDLKVIADKSEQGDTLIISSGTYYFSDVVIRKKIVILGNGYPVIDAQKKSEVFIVTADGVIIKGLDIRNTGRSSMVDMAGIKIRNTSNVQVSNCKITGTTYGVYLQNSNHCVIENNFIKSDAKTELQSGNGVHAWKCNNLEIKKNTISGHRDGIYFEFVTESSVDSNIATDNIRYGLHFMFSHNDKYSNNTFARNGAGVAVMYTKGVTMTGNTFYHNWGDAAYAILLKEISDSKIENNIFSKNTTAIFMEGSNRIHVSSNLFEDNGWAMRIQASCDGNVFEKNNFKGNSFDVATNGTMMLNTFRNNYWDKYEGYDLNRDGKGDVPYYPVSLYSVITERIPAAMILYRSFLTEIMEKVEKLLPSIIPDQLKDEEPQMKQWIL